MLRLCEEGGWFGAPGLTFPVGFIQTQNTEDTSVRTRHGPLFGEDDPGSGIPKHEVHTIGREGWIDRKVGAASLVDGEDRDGESQRPTEANHHHVIRADAEANQFLGQAIGPPIEFSVGELFVAASDGRQIGMNRCPAFEGEVDARPEVN